jgi:type I restriction enzyme S subunit
MSEIALIRAIDSLKKREGELSPTLKTIFFEVLKRKFKKRKIKEVVSSYKGGSWGSDYFKESIKAKVLRSPDIRFGFIDLQNAQERYYTKKEFENFSLKNNDILVIKSNGSLDLVGKSQIYKEDHNYPTVIASNFLMVLTPNKEIILPEYLDLFLKSPDALVWRFETQKTTTGLRNLNSTAFLNIEIPVPDSIEEQSLLFDLFQSFLKGDIPETEKEIKRFYSLTVQKEELSTELTHQLTLVKKLRQQLLQDAVQGKLVPQNKEDEPASELLKKIKAEKAKLIAEKKLKKEKELPPIKPEEIPFEIPENWVWCRLGEVCTKVTDGFHNTPPKASSGVPYIAATQVKSDNIDWENCSYVDEKYHKELYAKAYPQKGELLVVNIGAGCGTPAIIDVDFEFSFKNTAILKFNQALISNRLLFYYFILRKEEIYTELTKGGLQPFLSLRILNEINYPLPPFAEQTRIVQKLDELMQYCNELEASIGESESHNEKLLQQVLREALRRGPVNDSRA